MPQRAYRAHRGQATHPQGMPVDGLCEVRACDHRSPTTVYGLTRFACRAAFFVGVDALQDKNKCSASVCTTGVLSVLPKGPAPPAAGHGPAPSGRSPEKSGAARQPALRSRHPSLSVDDGDEAGHPVRVAAPALAHRDPQDAIACSRRRPCRIAVIPAHTCHLRHEAPGLRWIQDVGHGASGRSDDV